jgi:hypothetical protein
MPQENIIVHDNDMGSCDGHPFCSPEEVFVIASSQGNINKRFAIVSGHVFDMNVDGSMKDRLVFASSNIRSAFTECANPGFKGWKKGYVYKGKQPELNI